MVAVFGDTEVRIHVPGTPTGVYPLVYFHITLNKLKGYGVILK